jgi:hypothetical protein
MINKKLKGSLMYLVNTKPDTCFVVNTLSRFIVESRQVHWIVENHFLKYLSGTVEYVLRYFGSDGMDLHEYTDSDWEGNVVDRKITSGVVLAWAQ